MPEPTYDNYPVDDRPTNFQPFPEELPPTKATTKPKQDPEENDSDENKPEDDNYQRRPANEGDDASDDYENDADEEPETAEDGEEPDLDEDDAYEDDE